MFGQRRLKSEIIRLTYRVAELEERLCPCESHEWRKVEHRFVFTSPDDGDTVYRLKCARCGKETEKWSWEVIGL